jgi:hypothetical protein
MLMSIAASNAPMSGGPARALDGTMSLMVACDDAVFAQRAVAAGLGDLDDTALYRLLSE